MSKTVVMSIKPKWAEMIFNGKKHYELRKTAPKHYGRVLLYATDPVCRIVGDFHIDIIISGHPMDVKAEEFLRDFGLSHEEYMRYFHGSKVAYAIHCHTPTRFAQPLSLADIGLKRPPQSWCYVNI